jgi:hypothetical protein
MEMENYGLAGTDFGSLTVLFYGSAGVTETGIKKQQHVHRSFYIHFSLVFSPSIHTTSRGGRCHENQKLYPENTRIELRPN